MKKIIFILVAIASITFASCRETKTETREVIREVEVEAPETENREGVLERTAKEIDKEVNEEIDKTIQEIGNEE